MAHFGLSSTRFWPLEGRALLFVFVLAIVFPWFLFDE